MGVQKININCFAPSRPHEKQREVLASLDKGERFVLLRAGRKFRKTSLGISWLFEKALQTGLVCPYIAPNRVQAKNIVWSDHIPRILNEFTNNSLKYKLNEVELSIELPKGKVQLLGVENKEALRGISNWGAVMCLHGDSLINTVNGKVKIRNIKVGDKIITPTGIRKVLRSGKTGNTNKLLQITLSTGEKLICTDKHKLFTNNGVVFADELRYNDIIWTIKYHKLLSSKESNLGYRNVIKNLDITDLELEGKRDIYITKFGERNTERFQKVHSFTTKTVTNLIILLKIWFASVGKNIHQIIQNIELENSLKDGKRYLNRIFLNSLPIQEAKKEEEDQAKGYILLSRRLQNGISQRKVKNGIRNVEKKTGRTGKLLKRYVKSAVKNIQHIIHKDQSIVPHVVEIRNLSLKEECSVYNLTVEKDHCFFANNILVSNCDEYDDWIEDIYPTIIRPNLITYKAPILIAGTPKGFRNIYRLQESGLFKSFHFASMDNPDLGKDEIEALVKEYQAMGMGYYRQEILAEYVKPVGTVYEEWNMDSHYVPIDYDPNLPLHVTFDWGINDPTSVIWIQPYQSEIRVIDYYEASDANIEHFISVILSKPYKTVDFYTGDPAGKARTLTTGTSVIELLAKKGIYVRTKDGVKIPNQIRLAHATMNRLYVDSNRCERFRDCIVNYRYPDIKSTAKDQSNEIPIHDEYSHAMRAYEYWCVNTQTVIDTREVRPKWGTGQYALDVIKWEREMEGGDSYY